MKIKATLLTLCFSLVSIISLQSCKDTDETPSYNIPSTYDFPNVDYSGQTQRLRQLLEIKAYMASANTPGTALDEARLMAMYANDSSKADWIGTYQDSKQIKNKTFPAVQGLFEQLIKNISASSLADSPGEKGSAGVVLSKDNSKAYLLNAQGVEEAQLIEKGLLGAFIFYQIADVYTGEGKMNVDNEVVTEGKGTAMEHHWDEAFGYFGVPTDFPANKDNLVFIGHYCNGRDAILKLNQPIMDAYLKGRAAISNDDLVTRDECITTLRKEVEKVPAATAIHYINSGIANFDDMALRAHALSEAIAFVYALQFNPDRSITLAQVNAILSKIGGSADVLNMNLYDVSVQDLTSAKDQISSIFGFDDVKDQL